MKPTKIITASWDDGCASDVRVAELMAKYDIPTTFYWPVDWHSLAHANGYEPLEYTDALNLSASFDVGSHTITHRHLTKLPIPEAIYEIVHSKNMLEDLLSREITKFCPPRGYTTDGLTQVTLEMYDSQRLTKGPGLVHVHPNSGANGNKLWITVADEKITAGEDIEIWGHTHELDRFDMWDELEAFLKIASRLNQ